MTASFVNLRTIAKPTRKRHKAPATAATQLEQPTQRTLVKWLHQVLPAGSKVSATKNEHAPRSTDPGRRARFFQARKADGVVTGWPDLTLVMPGGRTAFIEAKRPVGGLLSAEQDRIHGELRALGHMVGVAYSIETARHLLHDWDVPLREAPGQPMHPATVAIAKPRGPRLIDDEVPF